MIAGLLHHQQYDNKPYHIIRNRKLVSNWKLNSEPWCNWTNIWLINLWRSGHIVTSPLPEFSSNFVLWIFIFDMPQFSDPDTTNHLPLGLTVSNGHLPDLMTGNHHPTNTKVMPLGGFNQAKVSKNSMVSLPGKFWANASNSPPGWWHPKLTRMFFFPKQKDA